MMPCDSRGGGGGGGGAIGKQPAAPPLCRPTYAVRGSVPVCNFALPTRPASCRWYALSANISLVPLTCTCGFASVYSRLLARSNSATASPASASVSCIVVVSLLIRPLQRHRDHHPTFHVHRMLSFVGHMRAAVFHLRDTRICVGRAPPFPCSTLSSCASDQAAPDLPSRRRDPHFLAKSVRKASYCWPLSRRTMDRIAALASNVVASTPTTLPFSRPRSASTPNTQPNTFRCVSMSINRRVRGNGRMIRRVLI